MALGACGAAGSALGVTVHADPAGEAQSWLSGTGDLLFAGLRGQVPLAVRLGVVAHADIGRLQELGRYCRRGSVRRAWGTDLARMAGDIVQQAGTAELLPRSSATFCSRSSSSCWLGERPSPPAI